MSNFKVGNTFLDKSNEEYKIIQYNNCNNVIIKFKSGNIKKVRTYHIKNNLVKDKKLICGVGINNKEVFDNNSYQLWYRVLNRCYGKRKNKFYKNIIVCKEWHDYKNFHKWYEKNYINGFELDKDLKIPESNIYSPETCTFVPNEINVFFHIDSTKKSKLPLGVNFSNYKKYKSSFFGFFNNIEDTVSHYWKIKFYKMNKLLISYPEFSELLYNFYEYLFNKHCPDKYKLKSWPIKYKE